MGNVVATLYGGLGNQLFQYAAARTVAIRTAVSLIGDITTLKRGGRRAYGLGDFQVRMDVRWLTRDELRQPGRLQGARHGDIVGGKVHRESGFPFDRRTGALSAPVRLEGYFQSEKYFKEAEASIRSDFTPHEERAGQIGRLATEILPATQCVSMHVRRGDYLEPANMKVHGVLGADYYSRALQIVTERAGPCVVCVFTDDPAWVRANLNLPADTRYVSEHTKDQLEDLILMSRCSHHITANSSFSWWGAWLNPSREKTVVTPREWFRPSSGLDTRDLRPEGWLQI